MTNEMTTEIALHCMKSAICEEVCEECPMYGEVGTDHCEDDAHRLAIQALEEIQQYRAIGTVEDIYNMLEVLNRTISELHSEVDKYRAIGTIDEFKALKEKNTPKKVAYQGEHEKCPNCGSFHVFGKHCTECGQAVDYD